MATPARPQLHKWTSALREALAVRPRRTPGPRAAQMLLLIDIELMALRETFGELGPTLQAALRAELERDRFGLGMLDPGQHRALFALLREVRAAAGDFLP